MWLEHGIDKAKTPEEALGVALVPEVVFGDTVADRKEIHKWGLPVGFLREEMLIVDTNLAMVYRVSNHAGKHEYGDRVLVDGSMRKPGPGEYLYWHGNAPAIGTFSVPIAPTGKKSSVKVRAFTGREEETFEVEADKLQIIGRLKGTWKRAE